MSLRSTAAKLLGDAKQGASDIYAAAKSSLKARSAQKKFASDLVDKLPGGGIMGRVAYDRAANAIREKTRTSPQSAAVYTADQLSKIDQQSGGQNFYVKEKLSTMGPYRSMAAKMLNKAK